MLHLSRFFLDAYSATAVMLDAVENKIKTIVHMDVRITLKGKVIQLIIYNHIKKRNLKNLVYI